jgi:hypothetical protein
MLIAVQVGNEKVIKFRRRAKKTHFEVLRLLGRRAFSGVAVAPRWWLLMPAQSVGMAQWGQTCTKDRSGKNLRAN